MRNGARIAALAMCILAVVMASGCATNPVTGRREFSLVSADQELSIGKDGYPAMVSEYGAYDDARIASLVDSVGKRLASVSQLPNLDWHFTVLDDPVVNAFAMPGGYVYITRGILAHLNSEAQLAGVLGHEIGHVTARHTAAQITKQQIAGFTLGLASALSGSFQRYSGAAQQAMGLLFLKYSRDNESQADELGVGYAVKAGYDPREIPLTYATLARIGEQAGQRIPGYLSTHPDPGDRETRTAELAKAAATGKSGLVIRGSQYVHRMDGIVFGNDPRQGWFEGTRFVQPEIGFELTFPLGWQTQNSRSAVAAGAPDKSGAMQLSLAEAKDRSAVEFVQQLASGGQIAGFEGQRETVGGLTAWIGHLSTTRNDGTTAALCAMFLRDGTRMFQLLGQSSTGDGPIFASMRTFRKVDDPGRLAVTPARVKVVTVPKSGAFSAVAAGFGAQELDANTESILNSVEPEEAVAAGTLLKLVPKVQRR